jgi:coilin
MEGFALPPFESTCILKDKDIIRLVLLKKSIFFLKSFFRVLFILLCNVCNRVKKKGSTSTEIIKIDDGLNDSLNVVEIIDKPPVTKGTNLLANEEFEKESGGYETESEEDVAEEVEDVENSPEVKTVSKKRKASKDLRCPKYGSRSPPQNGVKNKNNFNISYVLQPLSPILRWW